MTHESWWTIKVICGGIVGVFGLLAAVFALLDVIYGGKHGRVKAWFQAKWEAVGRSRWVNMPEHVIGFFVIRTKRWAARVPMALIEWGSVWPFVPAILAGAGIIVVYSYGSRLVPVILIVGCVIVVGTLVLAAILEVMVRRGPKFLRLHKKLPDRLVDLCLTAVAAMFIVAITYAILRTPLIYAVPVMALIAPVFWASVYLLLCIAVGLAGKATLEAGDFLLVFCASITLSFVVTLVAILVGHLASPAAWVPQTLQMVMSNVVLDGLTMVATFFILQRALAHPTLWRIVLAVVVDLLVAAILACLSLYLGLVFTSKALSLGEVWNVLIGFSPDGAHTEVGPYFWAMHTTFLPTLAYLGLILTACMGKALLIPVRWFFGVGYERGPLRLTVALFCVFAGLFWIPTYVAGIAEETAKKTPTTHKATSIPATSSRARATARAVGIGRRGNCLCSPATCQSRQSDVTLLGQKSLQGLIGPVSRNRAHKSFVYKAPNRQKRDTLMLPDFLPSASLDPAG